MGKSKQKKAFFVCALCDYVCGIIEKTREGWSFDTCEKYCPVKWHAIGVEVGKKPPCERSYYGLWKDEKDPQKQRELALLISELPEKEQIDKEDPKQRDEYCEKIQPKESMQEFIRYKNFYLEGENMKASINEVVINGIIYVQKSNQSISESLDGMPYVVIRAARAGVFAGYLKSKSTTGEQVVLTRVRKLWYWDGAAAVEQIAMDGVKAPQNCKFTIETSDQQINEVIQILNTTNAAQKSIQGVAEWIR